MTPNQLKLRTETESLWLQVFEKPLRRARWAQFLQDEVVLQSTAATVCPLLFWVMGLTIKAKPVNKLSFWITEKVDAECIY